MLLLMRVGYAEDGSLTCLLIRSRKDNGSTLNDVLKKFGQTIIQSFEKYNKVKMTEENLSHIISMMFGDSHQNDYARDLWEAGFDFNPELRKLPLELNELVIIDSSADAVISDAAFGGLENSNRNQLYPEKFWWESSVKLPEHIKAY